MSGQSLVERIEAQIEYAIEARRLMTANSLQSILADARELQEVLTLVTAMLKEWHIDFPGHEGDNEGPALLRARAILTKCAKEST